jgi:hypothetical protein
LQLKEGNDSTVNSKLQTIAPKFIASQGETLMRGADLQMYLIESLKAEIKQG